MGLAGAYQRSEDADGRDDQDHCPSATLRIHTAHMVYGAVDAVLRVLPLLCAGAAGPGVGGFLTGAAAGLILIAGLFLVADLAAAGRDGLLLHEVDGAIGVHPLAVGRTVIGAALGAHVLFVVIVYAAAGPAADGCHGKPSLSPFFSPIIQADGGICPSTSGCAGKFSGAT